MSDQSSLGHVPKENERWEFDQGVSDVFDDMLQRSIPGHALMRELTSKLAAAHVQPDTLVLDIGCSRGMALSELIKALGPKAASQHYIAVDASGPMVEAARAKFKSNPLVSVLQFDLRNAFPAPANSCSVITSVLTVMFTPIEHRQRIIKDAWKALVPGGALLFVEKVLGGSAELDELYVRLYYEHKLAMGYTTEEIDRKRLSLEGVLVPVTAAWNEDLLRKSGFSQVDGYWRQLNFTAWIAIK